MLAVTGFTPWRDANFAETRAVLLLPSSRLNVVVVLVVVAQDYYYYIIYRVLLFRLTINILYTYSSRYATLGLVLYTQQVPTS